MTPTFTLEPKGPFSLEEAGRFGFGQRVDPEWDGVMRLAFCVDGHREHAGVAVRQQGAALRCTVQGEADAGAVQRQVSRVLSLDHDGLEFQEVGKRDPVVARLQAAAPGLRPPLFHSPYEAAAWSVLSTRRPARQMAEARRRLSEAHGRVFDLEGRRVAAFPTPEQLLEVDGVPGLNREKVSRLHDVARAALEGRLDVDRIARDPVQARTDLRAIRGIGPFYAELIVVRASGLADELPVNEPKALEMVGALYGLGRPPTEPEFRDLAERWRPFRTWVVVLIRAAGPRILDSTGGD